MNKKWLWALAVAIGIFGLARLAMYLPAVRIRIIALTVKGGSCVVRFSKAAVIDNRYVYVDTYSAGSGGKENSMAACADASAALLYDKSMTPVCGAARGSSGCSKRGDLEPLFKTIDDQKPNFGLDTSHTVKEYDL